MLAKTCALLKVNSAKPKLVFTFGSAWLNILGSTSPGPGFTAKTRGAPTENQMRPPASLGMVQRTELPGRPRGMEMFSAMRDPVDDGLFGKTDVLPSEERR